MNSIHHIVARALPLVGALLLPQLGLSAESASGYSTDKPSGTVPAQLLVATMPREVPAVSSQPARIISPRLAAILAATLPPYVPATPRPVDRGTVARPGEENSDSNILLLPPYVVHGPRPPVFHEREVLTQRGLSELAQRRYITQLDHALNRYRIPLFGITCEARALAMYAEDERLQNMADLDRTARDAAMVDRVAGAELKRLADATYQRTSE